MIKTLVVDDEVLLQEDMKQLLLPYSDFICIGACGSIAEAKTLIKATKPDLVILDVQLLDGTSFELLEQLGTIDFKIIFLTAFNEYAIKAIKAGAFDYLMKPVDEEELEIALNKVKEHSRSTTNSSGQENNNQKNVGTPKRIIIRSQSQMEIIKIESIIYCQNESSYTTFFLTNNEKIMSSKPIGEYEPILSESGFIRCHQSYMVNLDYVSKLNKDNILILKNGVQIPVSTRKKDAVIKALSN